MDNLLTSCSVESALLYGPRNVGADGNEAGNVCLLTDEDTTMTDLKWYTDLSKRYQGRIRSFAPDCSTVFAGTVLEEICDSTQNMRWEPPSYIILLLMISSRDLSIRVVHIAKVVQITQSPGFSHCSILVQ